MNIVYTALCLQSALMIGILYNFVFKNHTNYADIDFIYLYIYNDLVYWMEKETLMSGQVINNKIINRKVVDQLNSNLYPAEIIEIIEEIERAGL
jgi:hypothetical protein